MAIALQQKQLAFAIWHGADQDRAGRKSISPAGCRSVSKKGAVRAQHRTTKQSRRR